MPSMDPTAKKAIAPPHLPETTPTTTLPQGGLADHGVYSDVSFAHGELGGQAARDVIFDTVHFKHVRLGGTRLSAPQLRDVRFDTCDFAEAAWDKAQMARIEVIDSRLLGFKAIEARIQDALFKGCNGTLALFWSTTFKAVRFQTCVLREASFYEADLSAVVFDRCDLRGADLRGAKVAGADFRGSQVEGMRVEGCDLRGVVIDPTQAVVFARLLGLVVRWDE
jgi:uncharacterized protein YjbI with pentapeptide repeats